MPPRPPAAYTTFNSSPRRFALRALQTYSYSLVERVLCGLAVERRWEFRDLPPEAAEPSMRIVQRDAVEEAVAGRIPVRLEHVAAVPRRAGPVHIEQDAAEDEPLRLVPLAADDGGQFDVGVRAVVPARDATEEHDRDDVLARAGDAVGEVLRELPPPSALHVTSPAR